MNPYYNNFKMNYPKVKPMNLPHYRGNVDDRGLLLPFLVGAAVAFPIGYIASNTNKGNYNYQPYYPMQYQPYYPIQQYPYYPR